MAAAISKIAPSPKNVTSPMPRVPLSARHPTRATQSTPRLCGRRPAERSQLKIEGVLSAHPDLAESAVFGVPHRVLGQEVKAVVRVADGRTLEEGTLCQWLGAELSAH